MTFIVLDTNVIIAALLSKHDDSATVQVMTKVLTGEITPVYSPPLLAEYRDVLQRKKFKFPPEDQNYIISVIKEFGALVTPPSSGLILPDTKDIPFYDAAKVIQGCYLVTGNKKHFPDESFILSPKELLAVLNENEQ